MNQVLQERFRATLEAFDKKNAQDPNVEVVDGEHMPHELVDAKRLYAWVLKLDEGASEELLLASRCQHICRWKMPRSSYPEGRAGYLKWRRDLKDFHADVAGKILIENGYPQNVIRRVRQLNLKQGLPSDVEVQTLEDALCLVFLEFEFQDFCERKEREMIVRILRKTWGKMSPRAREEAAKLSYSGRAGSLLKEALESA